MPPSTNNTRITHISLALLLAAGIVAASFLPVAAYAQGDSGFAPAPTGAGAPTQPQRQGSPPEPSSAGFFDNCKSILRGDLGCYVVGTIGFLVGGVQSFFFSFVWVAVYILEVAAGITLSGVNYGNNVVFLVSAWRAMRDIANMGFIFIMLFIAIATILDLQQYNARKLLPRLIIIALLVNFSMPLSRVIIDITNWLSVEFINAFGSLSAVLGSAFSPAQVLNERFALKGGNPSEGGTIATSLIVILNAVFASIFALVLTFVILAAAFLLFARYGVLVLVLIFSPLAFAANILPQTNFIWKKWLQYFLNNAFFAPIFLFFIWITGKIAQSSVLGPDALRGHFERVSRATTNQAATPSAFQEFAQDIGKLTLQYGVYVMFLVFGLLAARGLGVYGADMVIRRGTAMRKYATTALKGKTARLAAAALKPVTTPFTRLAQRYAERAGFTPGRMAAAAFTASRRKDVGEKEKEFARHNSATLRQMYGARTNTTDEDAAILRTLAKRGDLRTTPEGRFSLTNISRDLQRMRRIGFSEEALEPIEKQDPQLIERDTPEATKAAKTRIIRRMRNEDYDHMTKEGMSASRQDLAENMSVDRFKHVAELERETAEAFFKNFVDIFRKESETGVLTLQETAKRLREAGNNALAGFIESRDGEDILRRYEGNDKIPSKLRLDLASAEQIDDLAKALKKDDIKELRLGDLHSKGEAHYRTLILPALLRNIDGSHMREIYGRGDDLFNDVWGQLTNNNEIKGGEKIADQIKERWSKNRSLESFFRTGPAKDMFGLEDASRQNR